MSVEIQRTEVVLNNRGARGVNGTVVVTSATGQAVATRMALAAISSPVAGQVAYLAEAGREGTFVFDSSNLTTSVSGDTVQAIYVAPSSATSGASGAWVRRYSGAKNAKWFGAVGDNSTNDATALQAWLDSGGSLYLPAAGYYSAADLILRKSANVDGATYGFDNRIVGYSNMPGSRIRFAAGKGFKAQCQTTLTTVAAVVAAGAGAFTQEGAYNSRIANIGLIGAGPGTAVAGFYSTARINVENVHCIQFAGKGFDISASSDTDDGNSEYGNASLSSLRDCRAYGCGSHALHIRGRDANTIQVDNFDASANSGWGILDESFLGTNYVKPHCSANSLGGIKAIGESSDSKFIGPYLESGQSCIIGHRNTVVGSDITSSNTPPIGNAPPSIYAALMTSVAKLRLNHAQSGPGVISGEAYAFVASEEGLWLQGQGNSYDLSVYNKNGAAAASVPTGTTNWNVFGDYYRNNTKVLGAQVAGCPAAATDLATAITLVNFLRTAFLAHGAIAP